MVIVQIKFKLAFNFSLIVYFNFAFILVLSDSFMNQRQEFKLASNRSLIVYFNFVLIFLVQKKKKLS